MSIGSRRRRVLIVGLMVALLAGLLLAAVAVGAEPSAMPSAAPSAMPSAPSSAMPSAAPSALPGTVLESGDLRSEGSGPGLVGNPLLILGAVVLLGLATAAVTVAFVRLSRHD